MNKRKIEEKKASCVLIVLFLFLSAALQLSCSQGVKKKGQAVPGPVHAAERPQEEPADQIVDGRALTASQLGEIYSCWFKSPYDYMFSKSGQPGSVIMINGRSYGTFMGGIGGILHYGSLSECMANLAGVKKKSYSDTSPIACLADVSLYSDQMDESKPFGFFNPDIIKWGYTYMIPDRNDAFGGIATRQVYDIVFSRFFRMMAESYLYFIDKGTLRDEMTAYWEKATAKGPGGFDGIDYLQLRYQGALPQYYASWDGTSMTPQMALGFWLRRGLDGTHKELWKGLKKLLKSYDETWYDSLKKTYRSEHIPW